MGMIGIVLQFILGLVIGSFLNVVIYRLPIMMALRDGEFERDGDSKCDGYSSDSNYDASNERTGSGSSRVGDGNDIIQTAAHGYTVFNLCWPPSYCPHCQQRLYWWHNIPLISFILLKGRCYFCNKAISPRYPLIELITALITVLLFVLVHQVMQLGSLALSAVYLFAWTLIAVAAIDWKTQLIPDELSYLLLWSGLFYNGVSHFLITPRLAILGAMAGYLLLWIIANVYKMTRKQDGIGYGDCKLLAALGAWLGVWQLPQLLLVSSILALCFVLLEAIFNHAGWRASGLQPVQDGQRLKLLDGQRRLPFGPFLVIAGLMRLVILLCQQNQLIIT